MVAVGVKALRQVPAWVWIAGAAGVALYVIKKGSVAVAAQDAVAGAVGAAASAADSVRRGIASGVVLGIGDAIGIPRTDETLCEKAKREGNNFDVSKYCSADAYLKWQYEDLFN